MALIKFITNIFKKIAKLFSGRKGKGTDSDRLPGERRIGIYGPSNVGKSVFFTMLYQDCKTGREFRLDPDDPQTALQLVNNLNTLRGGDWLPGTVEEQELNFKAAVRGGSQFPFSTRDYKGETVDLEQEGAAKEKLIQYFQDCDAILFLLSPEMIADARKCEREIMSFTAMINQVTESGGKGLRIPIGLMITKSDDIDGFENDSQVTLISRKTEYLKAKDFEEFVEGICGQYHIARNIVFQEQVRDILKRLALFFDFLMTLSMEFQVFFVSSVGHVRRLEDESGETVVRPPENPTGIGVKTPFLWVIETIRRKEKIAAVNGFRRFVFRLALVVLVFYSIFYSWHFVFHQRSSLNDILGGPDVPQTAQIQEHLDDERDRWVVRNFGLFPLPGANASRIPELANKLSATYDAHRFLSETLPTIYGADALQDLSDAFDTPDWNVKNAWFTELIGIERDKVTEAVEARITAHNLSVAVLIEDLLERAQVEGASDEINAECTRLQEQIVDPPGNSAETRTLRARAEEICKRIGLSAAALQLTGTYDEIVRKFQNNIVRHTRPVPSEMEALRVEALEWSSDARRSAQAAELQVLIDSAEGVADALKMMTDYLAGEKTLARQLNRAAASSDVLKGLRGWVSANEQSQNQAAQEEAIAALTADIVKALDDPDPQWILGGELASRLRSVRLPRARQAEVDAFLANRDRLREEGADLRMSVLQAPGGYVVVAHDPQEGRWATSEAAAGVPPITVRWVASQKLKIGIKKPGSPTAPCPVERDLFELNNVELNIPCAGSGGGPTQVTFEGITELLEEDFIAPLSSAFAK